MHAPGSIVLHEMEPFHHRDPPVVLGWREGHRIEAALTREDELEREERAAGSQQHLVRQPWQHNTWLGWSSRLPRGFAPWLRTRYHYHYATKRVSPHHDAYGAGAGIELL